MRFSEPGPYALVAIHVTHGRVAELGSFSGSSKWHPTRWHVSLPVSWFGHTCADDPHLGHTSSSPSLADATAAMNASYSFPTPSASAADAAEPRASANGVPPLTSRSCCNLESIVILAVAELGALASLCEFLDDMELGGRRVDDCDHALVSVWVFSPPLVLGPPFGFRHGFLVANGRLANHALH